MKNKTLGVFNMAFVDILAGALGAVILLFVIVPKMDSSSARALEKVEILEQHSISLDSIIQDIAYLLPRDKVEKLNNIIDSIRSQTKDLKLHVNDLTSKNEDLNTELDRLKKELKRSQWKVEFLEKGVKKYKDFDADKMKKKLAEKSQAFVQKNKEVIAAKKKVKILADSIKNDLVKKSDIPEKGETMWLMGMNPDLAVILEWDDDKADVDLYFEKDGKFCDEENRKTKFGQWVKLPRKMRAGNSEFIIQKKLVPGSYSIYAHVYRPKKGASVEIRGKAFLHPDRTKYNKAVFGPITITNTKPPYKDGGGTKVGDLVVNEDSIQFISNQNIAKN